MSKATDGSVTVHQWIERAGPPQPSPVRLNELMADNDHVIADEAGEFEDWLEIHNTSGAAIDLTGLGLTDHLEGTPEFSFPAMTLNPGEYVVVWADEETAEGSLHAPFKLDGDGEDLYLTDDDERWRSSSAAQRSATARSSSGQDSMRTGCPTRGGRPPMSSRRVALVQGARRLPSANTLRSSELSMARIATQRPCEQIFWSRWSQS